MKKLFCSVLFCSVLFCSVLGLLVSCDNLGETTQLKQNIDDKIAYEKAETQKFTINLENVYDGTILTNIDEAKVGYPFVLEFDLNKSDCYFIGWQAFDGENIVSINDVSIEEDENNPCKVTITVNKKLDNLRFVPRCILKSVFADVEVTYNKTQIVGNGKIIGNYRPILSVDIFENNYRFKDIDVIITNNKNEVVADLTEIPILGNFTNEKIKFTNEEKYDYENNKFSFKNNIFISDTDVSKIEIKVNCQTGKITSQEEIPDIGFKVSMFVADGPKDNYKIVEAKRLSEFSLKDYKYGTGMLPSVDTDNLNVWDESITTSFAHSFKFVFEFDEPIDENANIFIKENIFYLPEGMYRNVLAPNDDLLMGNVKNQEEIHSGGLQIFSYQGEYIGPKTDDEKENKEIESYYCQKDPVYNKNRDSHHIGEKYIDGKVREYEGFYPHTDNGKNGNNYKYDFYTRVMYYFRDTNKTGGVRQYVVKFTKNGYTYAETFFVEIRSDLTDAIDGNYNEKLFDVNPEELALNSKAEKIVESDKVRIYRRPTPSDINLGETDYLAKNSTYSLDIYQTDYRTLIEIGELKYVLNSVTGYVGEYGNANNPLLLYYEISDISLPRNQYVDIKARIVDKYGFSRIENKWEWENVVDKKNTNKNISPASTIFDKSELVSLAKPGDIVMIVEKTGYVFSLSPEKFIKYDGTAVPIGVIYLISGDRVCTIGLKDVVSNWDNNSPWPANLSNPNVITVPMHEWLSKAKKNELIKSNDELRTNIADLLTYGRIYAHFLKAPEDADEWKNLIKNDDHYSKKEFIWFEPTPSCFELMKDNLDLLNNSLSLIDGADLLTGKYHTSYNYGYRSVDDVVSYGDKLRPAYNFYDALMGIDSIIDGKR